MTTNALNVILALVARIHARLTVSGFVYIMASKPYGTLYTGVTNDLARRVFERRSAQVKGFTKRYDCKLLVWYEFHDRMEDAIQREKSLKRYPRQWKINLITEMNPDWDDLYERLNQ